MAKVNNKKAEIEQAYRKERKRIQQFIRRAKKRGYVFEENVLPDKPKKVTQASVNRLKKLTPQVLYSKSRAIGATSLKIVKGLEARKEERILSARKAALTRILKPRKTKPKLYEQIPDEDYTYRDEDYDDQYSTKARDRFYRNRDDVGTGSPPKQIYATLENVREEIRRWTPQPNWTKSLADLKERDKSILENLLNGAIASQGEEAVARRLEENSVEINALLQEILYGSGSKEGNFKDGRTQVNFDLARFSAIIMGRSLTVEESMDLTDLAENLEVNN